MQKPRPNVPGQSQLAAFARDKGIYGLLHDQELNMSWFSSLFQ